MFIKPALLKAQENINGNDLRPAFHFTTDSNWINDPNGLVYFNGQYHLFAQYNPFGNKWGHMSWAHAVSTDMFNWKQLPLAIKEQQLPGDVTKMIFSGSAVIDSFNVTGLASNNNEVPFVAVYTTNVIKDGKPITQYQSLAYSLDNGNTWKQYRNNPILDLKLKDFRDPKVFWYQPQKKWIMVVAKPLEYKVQFYESTDLLKWKYLSEFGDIGNKDKIWECPDMYELQVEGSREKKWVLSVSAGHPQKDFLGMQYFTGNFNGNTFIADTRNYPLYVDYGKDYYAGVTYNNIPSSDGRTIMIGWANCWRYANDIPASGFRGAYGVPRQLGLSNTTNGLLLTQLPVKELKKHEQLVYENHAFSLNNSFKNADTVTGSSLDISFIVKTAGNSRAGVNVFKSGNEQTSIYYDNRTKTIALNRTQSGDTAFNAAFAGIDSVKVNPSANGEIKMRLLIDKSIVEVFINDGEYALTDLVFPKHTDASIEFFSSDGKADFTDVTIRRVNKTLH